MSFVPKITLTVHSTLLLAPRMREKTVLQGRFVIYHKNKNYADDLRKIKEYCELIDKCRLSFLVNVLPGHPCEKAAKYISRGIELAYKILEHYKANMNTKYQIANELRQSPTKPAAIPRKKPERLVKPLSEVFVTPDGAEALRVKLSDHRLDGILMRAFTDEITDDVLRRLINPKSDFRYVQIIRYCNRLHHQKVRHLRIIAEDHPCRAAAELFSKGISLAYQALRNYRREQERFKVKPSFKYTLDKFGIVQEDLI